MFRLSSHICGFRCSPPHVHNCWGGAVHSSKLSKIPNCRAVPVHVVMLHVQWCVGFWAGPEHSRSLYILHTWIKPLACLTKSSPVLECCAVLLRVAFRGALGTGHTAPSASPQSRVCGSRARSATLQTSSRPTRTATHSVRAARIALLAVFALHSPSSILAPSEMRDRRCDGVWSVRM